MVRFVRAIGCVALITAQFVLLVSNASAREPVSSVPASPLGQQLTWVIDTLNTGGPNLTIDLVEERFGSWFLDRVPPKYLIENLEQISSQNAPFSFFDFEGSDADPYSLARVTARDGAHFAITIAVEQSSPHKIALLYIQPIPPNIPLDQPDVQEVEEPPINSWEEWDSFWSSQAEHASFLAGELTSDGCIPIHALRSNDDLAIGSLSKVYVLGALTSYIENHGSWSEKLKIHETWKSRPPGSMQEEPAGKAFSLGDYAKKMISENDNTAAGHLIHFLGRKQVELAQAAMGHSEPDRNVPFLTTNEFIALKASAPPEMVKSYVNGSTAERRAILANDVPSVFVDDMDVAMLTIPSDVDTVGWFASPTDLCSATGFLHEKSDEPGMTPLSQILLTDNGPWLGGDEWPHAGVMIEFNDPGVYGAIELLQRSDGRWFVIAGLLNDSINSIQGNPIGIDLMPALHLLAQAS